MITNTGYAQVGVPFTTGGTKLAKDAPGNLLNLRTDMKQVVAAPTDAEDYISRQLGIPIENARLASKTLALTNPEKWLEARSFALNAISKEVSIIYADNLALYYNAGYSESESIERATQAANVNYILKKRELESLLPGADINLGGKDYEKKYRKMKGNRTAPPAVDINLKGRDKSQSQSQSQSP